MRIGIAIVGTLLALLVAVPAGGFIYQHVATAWDEQRFPPPGRLVEIEGQHRIHVHCKGEAGGKPTLVIEVGAGNWSLHWADLQGTLSQHARVCAYDRLGLGWSDDVAAVPRTGFDQVRPLHEALTKAGELGPYVLVGHSYGGYLVRLFYRRHPQNVRGIVLVEAAHEDQWRRIPALKSLVIDQAPSALKQAELLATFGVLRALGAASPDALPDPAGKSVADAAAKTAKYYAAFRSEIEGTPGVAEQVSRAGSLGDLPLLVISAGRSAYYYCAAEIGLPCEQTQKTWDALQASLVSLSTKATHVVMPKPTHAIQIDAPDEVARAIEAFVDRIGLQEAQP